MTRMYIANVTFTLDRFREAVRLGRELRDQPHASRFDLYGIALLNLDRGVAVRRRDRTKPNARRVSCSPAGHSCWLV